MEKVKSKREFIGRSIIFATKKMEEMDTPTRNEAQGKMVTVAALHG